MFYISRKSLSTETAGPPTHPQNKAAHNVLFCKQSDLFFGVIMWGRVDGVLSAVREAFPPSVEIKTATWQPDMKACSSLEFSSHKLNGVCVYVREREWERERDSTMPSSRKPSKHLVNRPSLEDGPIWNNSILKLMWSQKVAPVCLWGRAIISWCTHTLFHWKLVIQLATFHIPPLVMLHPLGEKNCWDSF